MWCLVPWHSDWSCAVSVLSGDPTRGWGCSEFGHRLCAVPSPSQQSRIWGHQIYDLSAADGPYRKIVRSGITPIRLSSMDGGYYCRSCPLSPDIRLGTSTVYMDLTTGQFCSMVLFKFVLGPDHWLAVGEPLWIAR